MNIESFIILNFEAVPVEIFSGGSVSKASVYNAGDPGSIPGSGRSPGEGNGHPLRYSCLENSMDRGAWLAAAHGVAKSQTRLSYCTFTFYFHHCKSQGLLIYVWEQRGLF